MNFPLNEQIEQINKTITSLSMHTAKSVQGIKRTIPFSKEKEKLEQQIHFERIALRRHKVESR